MKITYTDTKLTGEDITKEMTFTVEVEEATFQESGKFHQERFNIFLHDTLAHLDGTAGTPIYSIAALKDKDL